METNTQNEVTPETLASLATTAATVATEHEEYQGALSVQSEAEAALLERIVETVKPALRALACQIKSKDYSTAGRNGCNPVHTYDTFPERGVCLVDGYDHDKDETGNRGTNGGSRLYLLNDGRLAHVEREGTWSCWQGEPDTWEAELTIITAADAVKRYELAGIVEALNTKLVEQANGNKAKRTKAAKARAEKLAAVASLVGVTHAS
jgi:hypothetical protein